MINEIVDPLRPQLAGYERRLAELDDTLAAATTARERLEARRQLQRLRAHIILLRLRSNPAIRW